MQTQSVFNRWHKSLQSMTHARTRSRARGAFLLRLALLVSLFVTSLLASGQSANNMAAAATGDNAILFGGDGYVEVPYSASLSPTTSITIEGWVKRSETARHETLVGNGMSDSYWFGFSPEGKLRFTPGGALGIVDSNSVVSSRRWTHVAVTYAGATRRYYINGVLDTITTENGLALGQASVDHSLGIGFDMGSPSITPNHFLGMIDNVRIWSNVRTGAQIKDGMFQSIGAYAPGLLAEWAFNGDATDSTGFHDGTLQGAFTSFYNEGAIPHDIRIPQVSVTPSLDGFCYSSEYANATQVTVNGTPIWLLHTDTDLWVCFDGLGSDTITSASVYLDATHSRMDPAQPEHVRLTVNDDDTTGAQVGTGGGVYSDTTSADGLWDGTYRVDPNGGFPIYRAEFRIDADLLGGWEHVIGLALAKSSGRRGGSSMWPALGVYTWPSTWSNSILSGAGSSRTFSGQVVYQPRDFAADPVGIAGVRVELIASDPDGSEAVVALVETNLDGSFSVTSSDDYAEHRIEIGDLPRGYMYGTAEANAPGVVVDTRTIDYGAAPAGSYPGNVFSLGEFFSYAMHTENGPYFLIIAPQHIIDSGALSEFVLYKGRLGFEVEVVSVETVDATFGGAGRMDKIRALEQDRLSTFGASRFKYVMLVGSKDTIPFPKFTPWFHGKDSDGAVDLDKCLDTGDIKFKYSDWYYADLSSDFDSNGNGCLLDGFIHTPGKMAEIKAPGYVPDGKPAFQATVAVGRIPFDTESAVRAALSNTMDFEQQSEEFKQRALFAMSNYWIKGQYWSPLDDSNGSYTACPPEKDSGVQGVSNICKENTEDAAVYAEQMQADFMNAQGYTSSIFYEENKVPDASPVVSPQPLTSQNVRDELEATDYGMVNMGGHGSPGGIHRAFWNDINSNGFVDSPSEPYPFYSIDEIDGASFISSSSMHSLTPDNGHGSVFITAACSTSSPDKYSLGIRSLEEGHGVGWVGSLNVTSVTAPVNIGTTERLLYKNLRMGDALWQTLASRASSTNRKIWTKSANWSTALYGDPTLSYWGNPGGQSTLAAWPMVRYDALGSGHNPLIGPELPKVMWTYNATAPSAYPLPPSPVVSNNGKVIVSHGSVVDVLRNGALYQRLNLDAAAFGTPSIAADGTVYALDATGKLYAFTYQKLSFIFPGSSITIPLRERRWAVDLGSVPGTSPVIGADGFIAVGGLDTIMLVRPDGIKVGQTGGLGMPIDGLAVDAGRVIYAATSDAYLVKVDFFCPDGPCVQSLFTAPESHTAPLLAHGFAYFGRVDGEVVKFSTDLVRLAGFQADGKITAGPVLGPYGQILVGTENGTLYSLTKDLAVQWQISVGAAVLSVPASSMDAVYVVSGDEMLAYRPYSGALLWSRNLGSGAGSGSVAIGYGRELYAQTSSGKVVAVGEGWSDKPALFVVTPIKMITRPQIRAEWTMSMTLAPVSSIAGTRGTIDPGVSLGVLLQRSDGGEWEDVAMLPPGTTVYTDSRILPNTAYAYRLQVLNSLGNDSDYMSAEIVQSLPSLSQAPILDAVTTEAADALGLTWHSPEGDLVSAYHIERGLSASGPFTPALQIGSGMTTSTDTDLLPDTTYFYRVFAVNETGASHPSNVLSSTTRMLTLLAPQHVTATLSISGYVHISWTPGPLGATAVIESGEGTLVGYEPLGTADADGSYNHYPGEANTYDYRVKFVLDNAESEYTKSGLVILKEEYRIYLPLILLNADME